MKELVETLMAWRRDGVDVGRAVVVRTFGSAPRPEGAVLLATSDGRIAGSVSGGCVEGAVVEEITNARASGRNRVIRYGITDEEAWGVGLACGGTIDVLVEPFVPAEAEEAAREAGRGSGSGRAVITPLPAGSPGPESGPHPAGEDEPAPVLRLSEDGSLAGSTGDPSVDGALAAAGLEALLRRTSRTVELGGRSYFLEAFPRPLRLTVVGAGQVAIPLVAIARVMGYETIVVDGRPAFATRERFPDVDVLFVGWLDEVAGEIALGPSDAVAVLSHDPKFDDPAITTAFQRGCRYVGAIGSRKSQKDRRARLEAAGVAPADLDRLHGPIGLDLGGRSAEETALSIMAEIVATRYGATGEPKRDVARSEQAQPLAPAASATPRR